MNETPLLGAKVITADGEELGRVMEIDGGCFKVDARMQPDYWLAPDVVDSASPATVQLMIKKDELGDAIDRGMEHSGFHFHQVI